MEIYLLERDIVININKEMVEAFGGLHGLIKDKDISGPISRIRYHIQYGELLEDDIFAIAAKYAVAISQGHVFIDGNKRTAFVAMYLFLLSNGYTLKLEQDEVVTQLEKLACKAISEAEFETWLIKNHQNEEPSLSLIQRVKAFFGFN